MLKLVVMGTGTFAEPTLEAVLKGPDPVVGVFTQPDKDTGAKRGSTRQVGRGMKEIAAEAGVPVFQPVDVNSPEGMAMLRALQPDLLVVAAYGQILSKEVLTIPTQGGINVHSSLLPKYRGAAPIAWAVYHGETETGVTIIRMSASLDAGDILAQEKLAILPDETAGELETRLAPLGAKLALQTIALLKAGPIQGVKQDKSLATKAPKIRKEDGAIDWKRTAEQICWHIRAMQPWPTAYTFLYCTGKPPMRLIVNRAVIAVESGSETPGAVRPVPNRLIALGGDGRFVEILELQPAGKKRMAASEFLRGHAVQEGDHFGPEPDLP